MRYDELIELGRNHYSIVYNAHDFNTRRDVAIMELLPQFQNNPGRWNEIWQQVLTLTDAKLENSVPVFDVDRERRWIVMEKMNTALQAKVSTAPLDFKTVRGVLRQILEALNSLHKLDIYHGDIKPANLLVNNDGHVRLSFSPGLIMGGQIPQRQKDFKYLCPEMLNPTTFGDIGPQSDLYCLGFTALELLIGPEFDGKFKGVKEGVVDPDGVWMAWHNSIKPSEQLPSVAKLVPGAPQDLVTVIDRLLQKEVKNRYQSASEALADLDQTGQEPVILTNEAPRYKPEPTAIGNDANSKKGAVSKSPKPGFLDQIKALFASKPASTRKPTSTTGKNLSSTQKLNQYLEEHPVAKYTVIGLVCLFFLILLTLQGGGGAKAYAVEIESDPEKASLTFERLDPPAKPDDKKSGDKQGKPEGDQKDTQLKVAETKPQLGKEPQPTPAKFKLPPGEYQLHLQLAGYEKHTEKITVVAKSGQKFSIKLKPIPAEPPSLIPDGLVAVPGADEMTWEGKKLPKRARSVKFSASKDPMEFVLMMPGNFDFGVQDGVPLESGELAAAPKNIKYPYYIALTEVTNEQLQTWSQAAKPELSEKWKQNFEKLGDEGKSHPAVHVGFATAKSFSEWLSKRGRLPTEMEWEFAGRGTSGGLYPWDSKAEPNDKICNLAFDGSEPHTVSVTSLKEGHSSLGLAHLVGNVAEWCSDDYTAGNKEATDVPGAEQSGQRFKATRGGSFLSRKARLTTRADSDADGAGHVGFRVVVEVQPTKPASNATATTKPKAKPEN